MRFLMALLISLGVLSQTANAQVSIGSYQSNFSGVEELEYYTQIDRRCLKGIHRLSGQQNINDLIRKLNLMRNHRDCMCLVHRHIVVDSQTNKVVYVRDISSDPTHICPILGGYDIEKARRQDAWAARWQYLQSLGLD